MMSSETHQSEIKNITDIESESMEEKFVAALDVGTTTLRCQVINSKSQCISEVSIPTKLLYPKVGYVEIDPEQLWQDTLHVIRSAITKANLQPKDITSLGFTTQRSTFITWHRDTSAPFHNFITWKDIRCKDLVEKWNRSLLMKSFRSLCYTLYMFTRNARFLAGSSIKFTSSHSTMRLLWVLENIPDVKKNIENVMFGTLDTWLLYKFTETKVYVTEYGNASSTGLVDPFEMTWSSLLHRILSIPTCIYPPIVDNDYNFGHTRVFADDTDDSDDKMAIGAVMADQMSSMIGSCCYDTDTLKITLGTGTFLNVVTDKLHAGAGGIYPVIYSKFKDQIRYMAEGSCNDTGTVVSWALRLGLCESPQELSLMAYSVADNGGVYFVPAFSGLGPPIFDEKAASGFLGVKPTTDKAHLVRAILESIVYRVILQYNTLRDEIDNKINKICVDGGVSKNDFICQMLADMTNIHVERAVSTEMSVLGVAYVAGLNTGVWNNTEELKSMRTIDRVFMPNNSDDNHFKLEFVKWQKVIQRFGEWYS